MAKCHRIGQGIEKVPELHGTFHIEPVHAKDAYSAVLASNMPLERSASGMGRVVERYAQRAELMARKRELQGELESQLALFNIPTPAPTIESLERKSSDGG